MVQALRGSMFQESTVTPEALSRSWLAIASALDSVEAALGHALRNETASKLQGLYVIADLEATHGRSVTEVARLALEGGACAIQLRDKVHDKGDVLPLARELATMCHQNGAIFIMNDHADLAVACGADGLHVGQHDLPIGEARKILKPRQLVGRSNALLEEALVSHAKGADYVAVGSIFPTTSKSNTRPAGLETLRRVRQAFPGPLVAIGGINETNVGSVVAAGADAVCVISAVTAAPDPRDAARRLVEAIRLARPKV